MSYSAFQKRMAADQGRIHWQPEHFAKLAKIFNISESQVAKAVPPAPAFAPSAPGAVTKAAPADVQRSFRWTMNDGEIDRAGDIVVAAGVDTSHFRSNPIALLQHDPSQPIGTWAGVHAEGGKLKGTLNLAPTPLGEHVRENIAAGVLKAASVGFIPIDFEPMQGGGFRFNKIELMETSIVSIPASRGSLRERTADEQREHRQQRAAELKAEAARLREKIAADEERLRAERRQQSERQKRVETIPTIARGRAQMEAARVRRREEERVARMDPIEYSRFLERKAQFRERLAQHRAQAAALRERHES